MQTTLPASWYTNPKYHSLERRAVFLQSWFFLGTITKFKNPDHLHHEIAGIKLVAKVEGIDSDMVVRMFSAENVSLMLYLSRVDWLINRGSGRRARVPPTSLWACIHDHLFSSTPI